VHSTGKAVPKSSNPTGIGKVAKTGRRLAAIDPCSVTASAMKARIDDAEVARI
jgi:hypothetical protein